MKAKPLVTVYSLSSSKDGVIRYIGQTTGRLDRCLIHHHYDAKKLSAIHKSNWIRSVINASHEVVIAPIEENAEWGTAERKWIAHYRGLGFDLVNTTDGGEGVVGYVRDQGWRDRKSASMTGQTSPHKGAKLSPETRAKISASQKGRVITDEQRAKISAAMKGRKKSPEHVAKVAASVRARNPPKMPLTEEEIAAKKAQKFANLSARSKGKKLPSEHKARISSGLFEAYASGKRRGPQAKLTDGQVAEIIGLLSRSIYSQQDIAKMYGVSASSISEIRSGKAYKNIPR